MVVGHLSKVSDVLGVEERQTGFEPCHGRTGIRPMLMACNSRQRLHVKRAGFDGGGGNRLSLSSAGRRQGHQPPIWVRRLMRR